MGRIYELVKNDTVKLEFGAGESDAVKIAIENLRNDLYRSLGITVTDTSKKTIHIETVEDASYRWEEYRIEATGDTLMITGASRRGTIYGIYTLSKMLGVSPWYYFADVPVHAPNSLSFEEGKIIKDAPTVPYRGIFINDEEELDKWARLHMDEPTIGVHTYEKVFELLLRLKANYIWPAMHVNSFNMYPECGALAERMGVVVGTSHCDMLMRSNFREWEPWIKKKGYIDAKYDYSFEGRNREILKEYWSESVEQNKNFELSYTLGMRGIHDSGFETENLHADSEEELMDKKCALLEQVIKDQSVILKDVLGHDTLKTFVPYKEVLNLYDRGLNVPEDITLIWTNDNYGYVRRYPSAKERARKGGNGIYYHCSYWAPTVRHYLFLSSIPIAKTKYEMEKAYENGIQKLWVCNMGAIKPLEQEMEFFITLGWDIGKDKAAVNDPREYLTKWVKDNFPMIENPGEVADLLNKYARVSDTRKVEFMEEDVFSQGPLYNEAAIRLNTLKSIFDRLNEIYACLPKEEQVSFFELILMKVHAAYYTAAMYYFADRSYICMKNGKPGLANEYTALSKAFEDIRRMMLSFYNKEMAEGKWDGIVTPEDFPPPRTSMHPASVPGLEDVPVEAEEYTLPLTSARGYAATDASLLNCKVIKELGHATHDMVELLEEGSAEFSFDTKENGKVIIEIDRYPSLNSVGEIYTHYIVDGGEMIKLASESNDEWRGTWQDNITDAVERLWIEIDYLEKGTHKIKLLKASKYFALSKIVVYEGEIIPNRLGAITPGEEDYENDGLPNRAYLDEIGKVWYITQTYPERVISVGGFVDGVNVMDLTDSMEYSGADKDLFMPDGELTVEKLKGFGNTMPKENDGSVIIEAFSAYNQTAHAYTKNVDMDYATGVTYNRTNLALFVRKLGIAYEEQNAPTLHYDFECLGGEYVIYVLMRLYSSRQSKFSMEIDNEPAKLAWKNDSPWRYEAEKLFRYVPICKAKLSKGKHSIDIKLLYSGIRIERIVIVDSGRYMT